MQLSPRLRAQYPEEMTIVLQHQFWDLKVTDDAFEVGLSFGGVPERLLVPFEAIKSFFDPSVQFGLQFETAATMAGRRRRHRPTLPRRAAAAGLPVAAPAAEPEPPRSADEGGDRCVRLDRFRKK